MGCEKEVSCCLALLGCICSLNNNEIGDAGAVGLGEGLKTNTALRRIMYVNVEVCCNDKY
jgi:hypothetical protein